MSAALPNPPAAALASSSVIGRGASMSSVVPGGAGAAARGFEPVSMFSTTTRSSSATTMLLAMTSTGLMAGLVALEDAAFCRVLGMDALTKLMKGSQNRFRNGLAEQAHRLIPALFAFEQVLDRLAHRSAPAGQNRHELGEGLHLVDRIRDRHRIPREPHHRHIGQIVRQHRGLRGDHSKIIDELSER